MGNMVTAALAAIGVSGMAGYALLGSVGGTVIGVGVLLIFIPIMARRWHHGRR